MIYVSCLHLYLHLHSTELLVAYLSVVNVQYPAIVKIH